jgi:hypothetical protein
VTRHEWRIIAFDKRKTIMSFGAKTLIAGIFLSFAGMVSGCVVASDEDEGDVNVSSAITMLG